MKKTIITVLLVALAVITCSCKEKEKLPENLVKLPTVDDNYYIEESIRLANEVGELANSDETVAMYTGDEDVLSIIKTVGEIDFANPSEVEFLSLNNDKIEEYIKNLDPEATDGVDLEKLLKLNKIRIINFATSYNGTYGVDYIAALSVLGDIGEGYLKPTNFEGDFVVYLKYDGEFSALVEFREIGDNVISSTLQLVKNPDDDGISAEDFMAEIFGAIGEDSISVATVERE